MRLLIPFTLACLAAAAAPLIEAESAHGPPPPFPGWPSEFRGRKLLPMELNPVEREWERELPGKVARFRIEGVAGDLLVRWVYAPTRLLHPSRHCYRGYGFAVHALSAWRDEAGHEWSRFGAVRPDGGPVEVRELVVSADGGQAWPDVDSWYWTVARDDGSGAWFAYTWSAPQETSLTEAPRVEAP